jgi:hypothetical protein
LREAITVDPYNEHLHHRTITALLELGDHSAAARLHDAYLTRLDQTGLEPGGDIVTALAPQLSAHTGPTRHTGFGRR